MSKIKVGSLVRLNFTESNKRYFRIQGYFESYRGAPLVTEHDVFKIVNIDSAFGDEIATIQRVSDSRSFCLFSRRLTLLTIKYDPNQEPEDDCI